MLEAPPSPTGHANRGLRRLCYELAEGLRPHAGRRRVRECCRCRVAAAVEVARHADGRAVLRGLLRCGSVWECPVCQLGILTERAGEIEQAVHHYVDARVAEPWMLTATIRHGYRHQLEHMRRGIARAWQLVQQGAPWKRWRARVGLVGTVRRLEVTYDVRHWTDPTIRGNGWHPHLHVLLLLRGLTDSDQLWLRERWLSCMARVIAHDMIGGLVDALQAVHAGELQRAAECLEHAELYADNLPTLEHGAQVTACPKNYLAKLGLELAAPGTKPAHAGHLAPLDLAARGVAGDARALGLWKQYADAMLGARQLTWSRGLRAAVGLDAADTDETALELDAAHAERLTEIAGSVWDEARRRVPGLALAVLVAAEQGGAAAVEALFIPAAIASIDARKLRRVQAPPPDELPPLEQLAATAPELLDDAERDAQARQLADDVWFQAHAEHIERLRERLQLGIALDLEPLEENPTDRDARRTARAAERRARALELVRARCVAAVEGDATQ